MKEVFIFSDIASVRIFVWLCPERFYIKALIVMMQQKNHFKHPAFNFISASLIQLQSQ